jgi:hypothetical protein
MRQRHRIAIGFEIPQSSSKDSFPKSWRGQIFFKPVDQLGNVDRLSQNGILREKTRKLVKSVLAT